MRTEGQVRQKLKQAIYRHLKVDVLEPNFKRVPQTCSSNRIRQGLGGLALGCCIHPSSGEKICDSRLEGDAIARTCPYWAPLQTREELRDAYKAFLQRPRHEIAEKYPDLAALLWVLDEDTSAVSVEDETVEQSSLRQQLLRPPPTSVPGPHPEPVDPRPWYLRWWKNS